MWQASDARPGLNPARLVTYSTSSAGYPEGHADSEDKLSDIEYLYQKQQAGADFVVTQLFYDTDVFMKWYNACRERGKLTCSYPSDSAGCGALTSCACGALQE